MTPTPPRLNRSQLTVPASRPELFAKAARSDADVVMLDLEDSVPLDEKVAARGRVVAAIDGVDWGDKVLSLRVNGLDTALTYRDLIDVLEACGPRLDLVMLPKVERVADVHAVDSLIGQIEQAKGRARRLGLELLIESAIGLANVDAIAAACGRTEALHFGPGDFAASMQIGITSIGAPHPDYGVLAAPEGGGRRDFYPGDVWHYATSRLVVAARANGLRVIDGPYADFGDPEGLAAAARRAAAQGFDGKWTIHPSQIGPVNTAFTPRNEDLDRAHRIVDAMTQAERSGRAAVALDGRMVDIASVRQAEALLAKAGMIAARQTRRQHH